MFVTERLRAPFLRWILIVVTGLSLRAGSLEEALQKCQPGGLKPGYGICLFDTTGAVWSSYEGVAKEETGTPFSQDTILRIGGVSELFTVVMALRLADAGLIDPEQPIAAYLPEMFSGAPSGRPLERIGKLKVRLLMSHLSGTDANFFLGFRDYDPFSNLGRYLEDTNLKYPPETKYLRSGSMIDLLGLALEKTRGIRFEQLAETELFNPLGMKASSFRYQDSPQLASLRYKSAGPGSYATRIPGFRETIVPSGSMQSSIRDLVGFYSALLRRPTESGVHLLSPASREAMFSARTGMSQRQGPQTGYVWKLSLPELAHLGKVAWYSGKYFSHRNVVILLPDLGLGIVCATNAWSIFDRETILPMAIEVLKTYARENLKLPEAASPVPIRVSMPRRLKDQVDGLYASTNGVYRIQTKGDAIEVSSSAMDGTLEYAGQNEFHSGPERLLEQVVFTPPDSLGLHLKNGMDIEAQRIRSTPRNRVWLKRRGTYRITRSQDSVPFAFTLDSFEGLPIIAGDDGIQLLLEPLSKERAIIHCDESSRFFGKEIQVSGDRGLLLDGIPYQRIP
jgi:CubicO group peptidase (beta-lactamase class C family)